MPQFNLDDYEMVKDRIPLFYQTYKDGRITCDILSDTPEGVTMKAYLWKNAEEQGGNTPLSTGIARELPGGFIDKYHENCETSAVGRALANLNLRNPDLDRPSREEMQSAESMGSKKKSRPAPKKASATNSKRYCKEHNTEWFKRGKMRGYAHPIEGSDNEWCNMPEDDDNLWGDLSQSSSTLTLPYAKQLTVNNSQDMSDKEFVKRCKEQGWDKDDVEKALGKSVNEFKKDGKNNVDIWNIVAGMNNEYDLMIDVAFEVE